MNSLIKQIVESKFNFNIDIEPESVSKKSEFSKSDKSAKSLIDTYDAYHIWLILAYNLKHYGVNIILVLILNLYPKIKIILKQKIGMVTIMLGVKNSQRKNIH